MLLCCMVLLTGCSQNTASQNAEETQNSSELVQEESEIETESLPPPTHAPFPEADMNAVNFNDGKFSFISVVNDDDTSVDGTLSVENVDGNFMLKFTDNSTTADNLGTAVQKVRISVTQLLRPDQLETVDSIGFDIYAEAKDSLFLNDDGEYKEVPGWIGGGGGTMCADGKWYGFADFSASGVNEFDLQRSDAYHVEFKFLLAEAGKKWDSTVEDANVLVMRWGLQNLSDFYLDNITFYDAEGNAIPLNPSEPETTEEAEFTESESETEETT